MNINKVLKEFVKECSDKLNLMSIIQFGSSTYSNDPKDIDLIFVSNKDVISTAEILNLIKIMKNFEGRYNELTFDFSGLDRKRETNSSITTILLSKKELDIKHMPNDIFLFKTLKEDKDKKILFGKDPFTNLNLNLTNRHLFEMLSIELKWCLRKSLDDEEYKLKACYHFFKTFLRAILINEGHFKKEELLKKFKGKFKDKIKLPKNSEEILKGNLKEEDFIDVLKFAEDCLRYLSK